MLESKPSKGPLEDAERAEGDASSSQAHPPWQFSLKWLFGLTAVVAVSLWAQSIWGWWGGAITFGLVGLLLRSRTTARNEEEVGWAAGALAGFALVAVHGSAMEAAIYQEKLVPYNVAVGAVMF